MPDLRDDLDRLAGHAGEPASFDDLASTRRRRERRRRAEGLVVGLAVIVAAGVFLATTFRSDPNGNVPGASQPAVPYTPPAVPYLWPENWTVVGADTTLASVQAGVPAGEPYAVWRTDPQQVVERFADEVLGWPSIDVHSQESGASSQTWVVSRTCPEGTYCSRDPSELIVVSQPAQTGPDGIWSVERVQSDLLPLDIAPNDPFGLTEPWVPSMIPSDQVTLTDHPAAGAPYALGVQITNGCTSAWNGDLTGTSKQVSMLPGPVDPADVAGNCGRTGAGFAFAYTIDGTPNGDPFHEAGPLETLTAIPLVLDMQYDVIASGWSTYTDQLGWTLDVPNSWVSSPIAGSDGQLTYTGAMFASATPKLGSTMPSDFSLPYGEISFQVYNVSGGPYECTHQDSSFPLSYQDFVLPPGADHAGDLYGQFTGNGCRFTLASGSTAGATPEQTQILQRMVESIRFELDPSVSPPPPSVVTPSGSGDPAACLAAPATNISIVGSGVELSGCTQWAAGHRLAIDFEVRDAIEMGLELRDASGSLIWSTPIITGPDSYSFGVPGLDPGQYVLTDPVHPTTARLEISVGAY